MAKAHPGFKAVQGKIAAKEGISEKEAGAELAASTRKASPAAKKANPRLERVDKPKGHRFDRDNVLAGGHPHEKRGK